MHPFIRLLAALRHADQDALTSLRHDWEAIRQYVEQHDLESIDLPDDKKPALILWLSTPPPPEPIEWTKLTDVPSFVLDDRKQQLAVVDQLWLSWSRGAILQELAQALAMHPQFVHAQAWLGHARSWFDSTMPGREVKDQQVRLDVVAGYGAFIDQLLLEERQPSPRARIAVLGFAEPPELEVSARIRVPLTVLAEAIRFRSGLKRERAMRFAYAISLSLPAHSDILPTVAVEMDGAHCWLTSNWRDPLAAL